MEHIEIGKIGLQSLYSRHDLLRFSPRQRVAELRSRRTIVLLEDSEKGGCFRSIGRVDRLATKVKAKPKSERIRSTSWCNTRWSALRSAKLTLHIKDLETPGGYAMRHCRRICRCESLRDQTLLLRMRSSNTSFVGGEVTRENDSPTIVQ